MKTDKDKALQMAKTARGQIENIIKMMEEDRYCVDISNQILAVTSLMRKTNSFILRQHMNSCLKDAFLKGNGDSYVDEMMMLLDKFSK
ncbi:MAG: metal-sensing transcriptional repressor [Clostridia bacterium]|nr:metal-sensing transcriptional repressor [Clostridia bacterium]